MSGFDLCPPIAMSMSRWQAQEAGEGQEGEESGSAPSQPAGAEVATPLESGIPVQMSQSALDVLSQTMAELQRMPELVPSLASHAGISQALERAARSVSAAADQVEIGHTAMQHAFVAVEAGAKLAAAAALLIQAEMLPKVRICIRSSRRPDTLAVLLPRYQGWFARMDLNVYVAVAEHEAYKRVFQQRGISERSGVFLKEGGAGPGAQVQAALRDTLQQDHRRAKPDLRLALCI